MMYQHQFHVIIALVTSIDDPEGISKVKIGNVIVTTNSQEGVNEVKNAVAPYGIDTTHEDYEDQQGQYMLFFEEEDYQYIRKAILKHFAAIDNVGFV